ncbi:MAG: hypothetical protein HC900_03330 [Methylacidiphilales bacterium]|nr:hypothetical protein [Candidatus Methylacidiphilales bacterium]
MQTSAVHHLDDAPLRSPLMADRDNSFIRSDLLAEMAVAYVNGRDSGPLVPVADFREISDFRNENLREQFSETKIFGSNSFRAANP